MNVNDDEPSYDALTSLGIRRCVRPELAFIGMPYCATVEQFMRMRTDVNTLVAGGGLWDNIFWTVEELKKAYKIIAFDPDFPDVYKNYPSQGGIQKELATVIRGSHGLWCTDLEEVVVNKRAVEDFSLRLRKERWRLVDVRKRTHLMLQTAERRHLNKGMHEDEVVLERAQSALKHLMNAHHEQGNVFDAIDFYSKACIFEPEELDSDADDNPDRVFEDDEEDNEWMDEVTGIVNQVLIDNSGTPDGVNEHRRVSVVENYEEVENASWNAE